jgi:anti-anti-sigma factor
MQSHDSGHDSQHDNGRLYFSGELDLANVDNLRVSLGRAADLAQSDIVVDFTDVGFFDAVTVDALAAIANLLRRRGQRLLVTGLTDFQRQIIVLSHMNELIVSTGFPSPTDAIQEQEWGQASHQLRIEQPPGG